MAGLLDIGPLTRIETVRGKDVEVKGVSGEELFHLLDSFPELRKLFSGGGATLKPEQLVKQVPVAVAAIIAAATGTPGDKKAMEVARTLSVGEQAQLIVAIWDLTFPKGVQSFIAALEGLGQVTGSGWAQATPSPERSNSSLPQDTQKTTSGNTPQG